MMFRDFGRWCARLTLATCVAQAGCTQVENGSTGSLQRALVAPPGLSLGHWQTCSLSAVGTVHCWGGNGAGQLGYGNTTTIGDNEPASTTGSVSVGGTVAQIATGGHVTCALLDTGGVRCWGRGVDGQLGYGNTNNIGDDELPSTVADVSLSDPAVHIEVGPLHACAVLDTGLVQCWGYNSGGLLGYGHQNIIGDDEVPSSQSPVSAGGTVEQVAVGGLHTCALLDTGDVICWGQGGSGRLGQGSNVGNIGDNEAITSVGTISVGGTVIQLAAGGDHTCALLDTGAVRCWGGASRGQLGYGNTNIIGDNETPASAGDVPLGGTAVQITAYNNRTCALLDTGAVRCWGEDFSHLLGYPSVVEHIGDNETPSSAGDVDVGATVLEVAAGGDGTCARTTSGIRCWGYNGRGQLGYGNTSTIGDNETPASAGDVP